jgi:hypothetical protein
MEEKRPDPEKEIPVNDSPPAYKERAAPSLSNDEAAAPPAEESPPPAYDEPPPSYDEAKDALNVEKKEEAPPPLYDGDAEPEDVVKPPPGAAPPDPAIATPPPGAAPQAKVESSVSPPSTPEAKAESSVSSAATSSVSDKKTASSESASTPSFYFEQQRARSHRKLDSYSLMLILTLIVMKQDAYREQATMSDFHSLLLSTKMLMDLVTRERDIRRIEQVRLKIIDHMEVKLNELVTHLKEQKITPEEYSTQLKAFKQELQTIKKDQISMREDIYASNLLAKIDKMEKKVDRMETLGEAEKKKQVEPNQMLSKTKEVDPPKTESTVSVRVRR